MPWLTTRPSRISMARMADVGRLGIVGDHRDRLPQPLVQVLEEAQDHPAVGGVEVPRGLVGEHDRRIVDEGPGDRHPLLLARRQVQGLHAELVRQADEVDELLDAAA
jgi:hypothetical protein